MKWVLLYLGFSSFVIYHGLKIRMERTCNGDSYIHKSVISTCLADDSYVFISMDVNATVKFTIS